MGNLWLYPVSENSEHVFDGQPDTSLESFTRMLAAGGGDGAWSVTSNLKAIRPGDDLVIYEAKTKDSPPLIIGTASVKSFAEWNEDEEANTIDVKLNRVECKQLSRLPIDATYLMRRLPNRKRTVTEIPADLRKWIESNLNIQRHFQPNALDALDSLNQEAKTVRVKGRAYEAILRHNPRVIAPLRRRLRRAGWRILAGYADGIATDLVALSTDGKRILLVEGKTIGSKAGRIETRYAIGQLLDYEYFFIPTLKMPQAKCDRLILLERKPDPKFVRWTESLKFGMAWLTPGSIAGGPLAIKMLHGI